MKEIFEDYYKADANAPSGDGGGEPAGNQNQKLEKMTY